MSIKSKSNLNQQTLCAMLEYMQGEIEEAQTTEDLAAIFEMLKVMLSETSTVNVVHGLANIRAEVNFNASPSANDATNVATKVPNSLVSTFYDLSKKMNQLHVEDPETFQNASKALHWLANGETNVH